MKFRTFRAETDGLPEAQLMLRHPQNSGLQMDQLPRLYIPPFFIDNLKIWQGDDLVLAMDGGISISGRSKYPLQLQTEWRGRFPRRRPSTPASTSSATSGRSISPCFKRLSVLIESEPDLHIAVLAIFYASRYPLRSKSLWRVTPFRSSGLRLRPARAGIPALRASRARSSGIRSRRTGDLRHRKDPFRWSRNDHRG